MTRYLPLAAAVVLLGVVAVVQGFWTERWGKYDNAEIIRRVACLERLPMNFGRWEGKDLSLDERQLKIAKVSGVKQRLYKNLDTGEEFTVYLATGKARAISVHTPDKCYAAAGFRMAEDPTPVPVNYDDGKTADFYKGYFRKDTPDGNFHLAIYWSWNATGPWSTPAVPKVTFAKYPALYKMYVIRQRRLGEQFDSEDPTVTFLREVLPMLETTLDPAGTQSSPAAASAATPKAA
jgi:hypothetical protein